MNQKRNRDRSPPRRSRGGPDAIRGNRARSSAARRAFGDPAARGRLTRHHAARLRRCGAGTRAGQALRWWRGDASAGWCVSTRRQCPAGRSPGRRAAARKCSAGGGVAAGWAPCGTARSVDGGVVVSGRWPFAAGSTTRTSCSPVFRDDRRAVGRRAEQGRAAGPRHLAHIGLVRAPVSHDCVADDVFASAGIARPRRSDGPPTGRVSLPVFDFQRCRMARLRWAMRAGRLTIWSELAGGKKGLGSTSGPRTFGDLAAAATASAGRRPRSCSTRQSRSGRSATMPEAVPVTMRKRLRLAPRTRYDLGRRGAQHA